MKKSVSRSVGIRRGLRRRYAAIRSGRWAGAAAIIEPLLLLMRPRSSRNARDCSRRALLEQARSLGPQRLPSLPHSTQRRTRAAIRQPLNVSIHLLYLRRDSEENMQRRPLLPQPSLPPRRLDRVLTHIRSNLEILAQVGQDAIEEFLQAPASTPARTSYGQAIFKSSTPKEVAQVTPLKENSVRKLMNKEVPEFQAYLRSLV